MKFGWYFGEIWQTPSQILKVPRAFLYRTFQPQFHIVGQKRDRIQQRTLAAAVRASKDVEVFVESEVDMLEAAIAACLNRPE